MLGYAAKRIKLPIELIKEADRLGVHSVWTAEAYGSDAISPLAWLGALTENIKLGTAIMQMPGRTPANAAMTAMTLNQLSNREQRILFKFTTLKVCYRCKIVNKKLELRKIA